MSSSAKEVELFDGWVRVPLPTGQAADFHASPIVVDTPGRFQVRYSYFTMAPHTLPFAEMEEWYRVYDRFARLVRDPRHQRRFLLRPGDVLVYDNHRMLHGRTAFRGPRWVRGIYLEG